MDHSLSEAQRNKCCAAAALDLACAAQNKTLDDAWAVDLMNPFNISGASEYFPLAAPGLHVFGEQSKENFFGNQGMVGAGPCSARSKLSPRLALLAAYYPA